MGLFRLQVLFGILCLAFAGSIAEARKPKLARLATVSLAPPCSDQSLIGKRVDPESVSLLQTWHDGRWKDPEEGISSPVRQSARVILIHLWAPWCDPCKTELPMLAQLRDRLSRRYGTSIQFLFIADQTSPQAMADFVRAQQARANSELLRASGGPSETPPDPKVLALARLFGVGEQYYDPRGMVWKSVAGRCKDPKLPVTLAITSDLVVRNAAVGPIVDQLSFLRPLEDYLGIY